jgi:hypothetical protein
VEGRAAINSVDTLRAEVVGLGRVELPTNGLGKQVAELTGSENSGLYYIRQSFPMTTI